MPGLQSSGVSFTSVEEMICRHLLRLVIYGVEHSVLSHGDAVPFDALQFLVVLWTRISLESLDPCPNLSPVSWRETLESLEKAAGDPEFIHQPLLIELRIRQPGLHFRDRVEVRLAGNGVRQHCQLLLFF